MDTLSTRKLVDGYHKAFINAPSGGTYTWSGSPSASVSLEGQGHIIEITSIVFTIE